MATIQERFETFHKDNPEVYEELVRLANAAVKRGRTRLAIEQLWQVIRWDRMMSLTDESQDTFKLSDHYRSRYARLIMEKEKDLEGIFRTRELRAP